MSTESSQIFHQSAPRHDHVAAPFVTSVRAAPLHTLDTPLFPHIVKPAKACGHLYAVRQSGSQGCRSPAENVHQTIESHWRKPPTAGFRGRGGGCLARSKNVVAASLAVFPPPSVRLAGRLSYFLPGLLFSRVQGSLSVTFFVSWCHSSHLVPCCAESHDAS